MNFKNINTYSKIQNIIHHFRPKPQIMPHKPICQYIKYELVFLNL